MSQFVDEVVIEAKAGDGGNGAVAWRREAHVPKGGPAGGDGGNGGDVVLVADDGVHSLLDFQYVPHLKAKNGGAGRGKKQAGEDGADAVAYVPIGTQVLDADGGEILCDLTAHGQRFVACKGGSGGFGNSRFATPSRQAPEFAKPGLAGDERRLRLSLKLMADVGLLGFPNAGKSTLLSRVSAARPKIANYPFTTLVPQLGVVQVDEGKTFVMADIPGVIEGAAQGKGLGIQFLKHLERVRVLCHLIEIPLEVSDGAAMDVSVDDDSDHHKVRGPAGLVERYTVLRNELAAFSSDLAAVDEIVVVNKTDLVGASVADEPEVQRLKRHLDDAGVPLLFLSGQTGDGLERVKRALYAHVQQQRNPKPAGPAGFNPARSLR